MHEKRGIVLKIKLFSKNQQMRNKNLQFADNIDLSLQFSDDFLVVSWTEH